jgi:hypothetical protein
MKRVPAVCATCKEGTLVVERVANTTRLVIRCAACGDLRPIIERRVTTAARRKPQRMNSDRESPIKDELPLLRAEVAALLATLGEIRAQVATLHEEVSDLRASAERWRTLYEAAIRRGAERERD